MTTQSSGPSDTSGLSPNRSFAEAATATPLVGTTPSVPPVESGIRPGAASGNGLDDKNVKVRGRLLRLMISMFVANIGIFAIWGAVPGLLLATQVQNIDPGQKALNLAIVSTLGAFAAMIAQPIAGMVSDRTRSRFGRRAPWMVAGVLIGGLALVGLGSANTIVQIAIVWIIIQVAYNFAQGPLSAVLPDRVPHSARGKFSSFAGVGLMLGSLGGSVVAVQFVHAIPRGYAVFAGFALIVIVLFVVFNPDRSNKAEPRERFDLRAFVKTFWVSPRKHPDFAWGFTGRLLLYVGYFLVSGYQLYILQDYIGLKGRADAYVPVLSIISLVGIIISTMVAGPLSDRLGKRRIVAVFAGVLMAIALVVPWVMPTITGMMIYSLIVGFGFGSYQAVDTALMSEVLPSKEDFAKDLGVLNIAATLPQTIGPALAGLIVVSFGGYAALFPIGVVIALAGAFAVLPIKSVK
jgi:MFS family permease